jgi:hypothetical protein
MHDGCYTVDRTSSVEELAARSHKRQQISGTGRWMQVHAPHGSLSLDKLASIADAGFVAEIHTVVVLVECYSYHEIG